MRKITIYPIKDFSEDKPLLREKYGFLIEEEGKPDKVVASTWDYWGNAIEKLGSYLKSHLTTDNFIDISKKQ